MGAASSLLLPQRSDVGGSTIVTTNYSHGRIQNPAASVAITYDVPGGLLAASNTDTVFAIPPGAAFINCSTACVLQLGKSD